MWVLITGANGFVGRSLCAKLQAYSFQVRGTVRSVKQATCLPAGVDPIQVKSIGPNTDWSKALSGVKMVVHLAARVHVMQETSADPLSAFRQTNVGGTARLAQTAADAGVRRFVFVSSIGVNGNVTFNRPFTEKDVPQPHSPYALSKLEAEHGLHRIASASGMEVVIIRSPLVYGAGNPGNFFRLLRIAAKSLPLPLASINNQRSMIYVGNLVDAIMICLKHPKAAGEIFLVSDGQDVSTPDLIRMISVAMGKKSRLLPLPPALLNNLGKLTGKSAEVERLIGSLRVDSSKIRRMLDWEPPFTMEEGIQETVNWFTGIV